MLEAEQRSLTSAIFVLIYFKSSREGDTMMEPGPHNLRNRMVEVTFIEPMPTRTANGQGNEAAVETQVVALEQPRTSSVNPPQPAAAVNRASGRPRKQKLSMDATNAECDSQRGYNFRKRKFTGSCSCCDFKLTGTCQHSILAKKRKSKQQNGRTAAPVEDPRVSQPQATSNQALVAIIQGNAFSNPQEAMTRAEIPVVVPDTQQPIETLVQPLGNVTAAQAPSPVAGLSLDLAGTSTHPSGAVGSRCCCSACETIDGIVGELSLPPLDKTPDLFDELLDGDLFKTHDDIYKFLGWDEQNGFGKFQGIIETSTNPDSSEEIETITIPESPHPTESASTVAAPATIAEDNGDFDFLYDLMDEAFPPSPPSPEPQVRKDDEPQPGPSSAIPAPIAETPTSQLQQQQPGPSSAVQRLRSSVGDSYEDLDGDLVEFMNSFDLRGIFPNDGSDLDE